MRNKVAGRTDPPADMRSKNLRSVQLLAEDMLGRAAGNRIPTTIEYQKQLGVGSGTVQKAMAILENSGAVTLSRHGHLGTRLLEQDEGVLWSVSGRGQVRLVLHPPGAIDGFGLLQGLHTEFDELSVPLDVRYLQGGEARAELVTDGTVDLAVLSASAAGSLRRGLSRKLRTVELGAGIYYAPGSLSVVRRASGPKRPRRLRVAIDRASHDHEVLTEAEFPPGSKHAYVDCPYPEVLTALLEDRIDAGVWHNTLLPVPLAAMGLTVAPLTSTRVDEVIDSVSEAVLLLRRDDHALGHLVERIDVSVLVAAQSALLGMDPASPELHTQVWMR